VSALVDEDEYADRDGKGEESEPASLTVTVENAPPQAVAKADPPGGIAPLTIQFDASGSQDPDGSIASYEWDLGDGQTSSGVQVRHEYAQPNTYIATLVVTDRDGATDQRELKIEVRPVPQAAQLLTNFIANDGSFPLPEGCTKANYQAALDELSKFVNESRRRGGLDLVKLFDNNPHIA